MNTVIQVLLQCATAVLLQPSTILQVYDVVGIRDSQKEEPFPSHRFINAAEAFIVVQSDDLTTFSSDTYEFDAPASLKFVHGQTFEFPEGKLSSLKIEVEGLLQDYLETPNGNYYFAVMDPDPRVASALEEALNSQAPETEAR